jgi:methyl-accepting chemotaxis protein
MISRIYRFFAQSIRNRLLLAMIAVSLPALLGGVTYSVYVTRNLALSSTKHSQQNRVTSLALSTGEILSGVRGDVLFLSRLDPLHRMLEFQLIRDEATYETARQTVEQTFLDFSQAKGIYYQVRFMDAQGMEVVRVDSDGTQFLVAPRDQLQNQAAWLYSMRRSGRRRARCWFPRWN